MITAEIRPKDLKEFNKDMKALRPKELLKGELGPFAVGVIREVAQYPRPSGYPRTGHLGRSWYHRLYGLDVTIGNSAIYAGYVQGEEQLAHHGAQGWKRLMDVAVTRMDKLIKHIMSKMERLW